MFQYCIELEANLASLGDNSALANARKLYDSAIDYYPQEREVWRNYYNLELKVRSWGAIDIFFFSVKCLPFVFSADITFIL